MKSGVETQDPDEHSDSSPLDYLVIVHAHRTELSALYVDNSTIIAFMTKIMSAGSE
jgi:hypothetical protein